MIELALIASTVVLTPQQQLQESIDRMCAHINHIPYASDNLTDNEWANFKLCRDIMYDHIYHKQD